MRKFVVPLLSCFASVASAQVPYDWFELNARVVSIEVTYMPSLILFSTDASVGSCPAGTFLRWNGNGADVATKQSNAKSVLAALMAAKLSGTAIRMYGVNANCEVRFVYFG